MAGASALCRVILREARKRELAEADSGLTYLLAGNTTMAAIASGGGRQMVSASAAGKSYAWMAGIPASTAVEALDEACGIWESYDDPDERLEYLQLLLDRRANRSTYASFR